jgi:hypothetical protein
VKVSLQTFACSPPGRVGVISVHEGDPGQAAAERSCYPARVLPITLMDGGHEIVPARLLSVVAPPGETYRCFYGVLSKVSARKQDCRPAGSDLSPVAGPPHDPGVCIRLFMPGAAGPNRLRMTSTHRCGRRDPHHAVVQMTAKSVECLVTTFITVDSGLMSIGPGF